MTQCDLFFFLSLLGFELRASRLLGRYSYSLSHSASSYSVILRGDVFQLLLSFSCSWITYHLFGLDNFKVSMQMLRQMEKNKH
jgi:hypothetical protein